MNLENNQGPTNWQGSHISDIVILQQQEHISFLLLLQYYIILYIEFFNIIITLMLIKTVEWAFIKV